MEQQHQPIPYQNDLTEPMTVKQWLGTLALLLIPFANFVLMFVWAFGSGTNINKRNFFRAQLLLAAIIMGVYLLIFILLMVMGITLATMR